MTRKLILESDVGSGQGLISGSFAGKTCTESLGGSLQLCCLKRLTPPDLPLQKSCLPGLPDLVLFCIQ